MILTNGEGLGEEQRNYFALLSDLQQAFRPTNHHAEILVEKLAFLYLRLSRVYKADIRSAPKLLEAIDEELSEPTAKTEYVGSPPQYQLVVVHKNPSAELLIRYESHTERQITRTLEQLRKANLRRQLPIPVSDEERDDDHRLISELGVQ